MNALKSFLAAIGRLFHHSPQPAPDPDMPDNTALTNAVADAKAKAAQLATANGTITTLTQQVVTLEGSLKAEQAKSADLQTQLTAAIAQLDALPDEETVADAVTQLGTDSSVMSQTVAALGGTAPAQPTS